MIKEKQGKKKGASEELRAPRGETKSVIQKQFAVAFSERTIFSGSVDIAKENGPNSLGRRRVSTNHPPIFFSTFFLSVEKKNLVKKG